MEKNKKKCETEKIQNIKKYFHNFFLVDFFFILLF